MEDLRLVGVSDDGTRLVVEGRTAAASPCRWTSGCTPRCAGTGPAWASCRSPSRGSCARARSRSASEPARRPSRSPRRPGCRSSGCAGSRGRSCSSGRWSPRRHSAVGVRRLTDSVTTPLGVLVTTRLEEHAVEQDSLDWDSWLLGEGRWLVRLTYRADDKERTATWLYDPAKRSLEPADDEARWLTDEERATSRPPRQRAPRLAAVPAQEPDEEAGRHDTVPLESRRRPRAVPDPEPDADLDVEPDADVDADDTSRTRTRARRSTTRWTSPPTTSVEEAEPAPRRDPTAGDAPGAYRQAHRGPELGRDPVRRSPPRPGLTAGAWRPAAGPAPRPAWSTRGSRRAGPRAGGAASRRPRSRPVGATTTSPMRGSTCAADARSEPAPASTASARDEHLRRVAQPLPPGGEHVAGRAVARVDVPGTRLARHEPYAGLQQRLGVDVDAVGRPDVDHPVVGGHQQQRAGRQRAVQLPDEQVDLLELGAPAVRAAAADVADVVEVAGVDVHQRAPRPSGSPRTRRTR